MTTQVPDDYLFRGAWLRAARREGEEFGRNLLALPVSSWRDTMSGDRQYRSYGALAFLLEAIHEDLHQHPAVAYERIVVVLEYVDRVEVPDPSFSAWLRGTAWREYANALRVTKNPKTAIGAAQTARKLFETVASLTIDVAKSELVEAQALREVGDYDRALFLARQAAETFNEHGESQYYCFARTTEAWVLFGFHQYAEALSIFSVTAADAEARGDKRTVALCLYNAAECARALGEMDRGRELNRRAVELLNAVGVATDTPRVRWAHAVDIARHGNVEAAVSELFTVQGEFLALGMNTDAATAALDVVRLKVENGEEVGWLCRQLVQTFSEAGMTASAIEALAYLREEAKRGTITANKIVHVRTHLNEVARMPALIFLPPPNDEEER